MVQKWEYRRTDISWGEYDDNYRTAYVMSVNGEGYRASRKHEDALCECLNHMGSEGWELVSTSIFDVERKKAGEKVFDEVKFYRSQAIWKRPIEE